MTAEILREEEVTVFLVICHIKLERSKLHTTPARYTLGSRLLLREYRLQLELAKLHVGSYTEKTAGALDERGVAGKGYIARLNQLDNLIFLAIILQLHVLGIVVEGGIGVVIQVEVHLIAYLSIHVEIDLLIKVHHRGLAVADRQRRVVDILLVDAKLQFGSTLGLDTDSTGSEDFLGRSQIEVHIREIEFLLALRLIDFIVLLAIEGIALVLFRPFHIFIRSEHDGSRKPGIAHPVADDITVEGIIVDDLIPEGIRTLEVERTLIEIAQGIRLSKLDFPTGMQQGIRNRILIYLNGLVLWKFLVLLRKRQSEGVAEGCHHQPSHQKIKDSLPLHKVTGFASARSDIIYFCQKLLNLLQPEVI